MKKYILLLATLSGTCGIAYEILYSRMLSTYLGDMFYVTAATLTAFLLSLGIGSLIAAKWPKSLGWIEIAIGIYAIFVSYIFANHGEQFVTALVNTNIPTPLILMASVFSILIIPAMMIGFSVPLFTLYAKKYSKKKTDNNFGWVYFSYNIGAAICVLAIEYILLREFGISKSTQFIAMINIIIGVLILKIPAPQKPKNLSLKFNIDNKVTALFMASFASGILQLFYIKLTGKIFGPFHENFAIILTIALLGIALGSALVTVTKLRFQHILLIAGISTAAIFSLLGEGIHLWAYLNAEYFGPEILSWLLKIIMIFALALIPLIFIGGAIPAFLKDKSINISTGQALAVSSFGNCIGFLTMLFAIHKYVSDAGIAIIITITLMLSAILFNYKKVLIITVVCLLFSVISISGFWPEKLMQLGFKDISQPRKIQNLLTSIKKATTYKGINSTVDLITTQNDQTMYIINGYKSLSIGGAKKANLRELTFGMTPAIFSKNNETALVLGLGTGLTSAGTAGVFKHVDVVEINPLIIDMLDVFENDNLHLSKQEHVDIQLQDGLIALMQKEKKYDAILNTVTSPAYFSSAKLYTADFFQLAASKLNDGGVYAIWFDGRTSDKGVQIIFNSLKTAFNYCRPTHLSTNYHQVICSNTPLSIHKKAVWSPEIVNHFTNELYINIPIQEYLSSLVLYSHPRFYNKDIVNTEWDAPINTFNYPTLEFDISMNLFSRQFNINNIYPQPAELKSPYDKHNLNPYEFARRCAVFAIISTYGNITCLEESIYDNIPIDLNEYIDITVNHFIKNNSFSAIFRIFNAVTDNLSGDKLLRQIEPFMCNSKFNNEQRSSFQYKYIQAVMAQKKPIPMKILNEMLVDGSIPAAKSLAANLSKLLETPGMGRQADTILDPCKTQN